MPANYVGIDITAGRGVDEVCDVADLVARFGASSFDLVISTEMLEHVYDWPRAVNKMKEVLRPEGVILFTTRSPGFPLHGYPDDSLALYAGAHRLDHERPRRSLD